jgi:hypothetical protein
MSSHFNLSLLKWHLLALLLAAIAGSAAAFYGQRALDQKEQTLHDAQQRLVQQHRAAAEAETAQQEAERHQAAYENLQRRGFFQNNEQENETRFRLIAFVENLQARFPFAQFSYAIQPPAAALLPPSPAFNIHQHRMTLRAALAHEGWMLALLDALQHAERDVFLLERCTVTRAETGLDAECAGDWITFSEGRAQ